MLLIRFLRVREFANKLAILSTIIFWCGGLHAQNESLLDEVAMKPMPNAFGDPLNNGLSPSMVKFGTWFYIDALGQNFYKRQYIDGKITEEVIFLKNVPVVIDGVTNVSELNSKASLWLSQQNITIGYQKGCAFVVNLSDLSFASVIPYGQWDASELEKFQHLFINTNPNPVVGHVAIIWK